ncbi:hypothetical protein METP3_02986 [Methanosarcinales archaeon]|nr:hypothetical protein METP3_02986 [Methanosarcinales archaeon]
MKKRLLIVIIILGLVSLGIAISGCVSDSSDNPSSYASPVSKSPVYKTINQNIVNGFIPVKSGEYVYYQLSIPSQASVSGDFTAFGGSGNDIDIFILDETAYTNWINKHSVSTYYNSGQMTTGSITTSLPAGKYYLIYSNTFSTFSDKNVKTNLDVSYTICVENC